jgi:hypothetical protein
MALYDDWCELHSRVDGLKRYWTLSELPSGRAAIADRLTALVRSHYDTQERIADDIEHLGYDGAAAVLRTLMPTTRRARAGDLGEILAVELTEEHLEFRVPVRRLRYKDGREVPMRGDDFIGVNFAEEDGGLWLLKGEAKSRRRLGRQTIAEAREALTRDGGRCAPHALLFVANRLLESDDASQRELGRLMRNEVGTSALPRRRIDHALFTMSGNGAPASLEADFETADGRRGHEVVNLHIADYDEFLVETYDAATDLGDG